MTSNHSKSQSLIQSYLVSLKYSTHQFNRSQKIRDSSKNHPTMINQYKRRRETTISNHQARGGLRIVMRINHIANLNSLSYHNKRSKILTSLLHLNRLKSHPPQSQSYSQEQGLVERSQSRPRESERNHIIQMFGSITLIYTVHQLVLVSMLINQQTLTGIAELEARTQRIWMR